jgi:hypothetical protein
MNQKHFLINPKKTLVAKEVIESIREEGEMVLRGYDQSVIEVNKEKINQQDSLVHTKNRVILKINTDYKNSHTFENGSQIRIERKYNNFNVRETHPVNAIVISAENIPTNSEILIDAIEIHDSNRIFNYKENNSDVKYYSFKKEMCFAYYDNGWKPLEGWAFGLRIFKPYVGLMTGIEPTIVKDVLWVTTGEYSGSAVRTLLACDYQIVFQDRNGREGNIIRFRPDGNKEENREPEAIAILHDVTERVVSGEYLVGITTKDAKPFKDFVSNN